MTESEIRDMKLIKVPDCKMYWWAVQPNGHSVLGLRRGFDPQARPVKDSVYIMIIIIIIMEICNVSSPRLKALNKRNTYNVHRHGECYPQFNKS